MGQYFTLIEDRSPASLLISPNQTIRIYTTNPQTIQTLTDLYQTGAPLLDFIGGTVVDDRPNPSIYDNHYHWHWAPDSLVIAPVTAEGTNSRPEQVEGDITYWAGNIFFWPGRTRVVSIGQNPVHFGDNTFGSGNFGDTANAIITPPTLGVIGTVSTSLAGAITAATPATVLAAATPGTMTFTRNAVVFAPTAATFGAVGQVIFGTVVSPATFVAQPTSFGVPGIVTGTNAITPGTFHAIAKFGLTIPDAVSSLPPPLDIGGAAALYAVNPFRDFVYSPAFVRQRHRFRGQRESYKLNAEMSAFLFDVLKLYERGGKLNVTLDANSATILGGGSVANALFFSSAGSLSHPQTFGAPGVTFGEALGTFGHWGGAGTLVSTPLPFDFEGIEDLGLRLDKLRYRVASLERALL